MSKWIVRGRESFDSGHGLHYRPRRIGHVLPSHLIQGILPNHLSCSQARYLSHNHFTSALLASEVDKWPEPLGIAMRDLWPYNRIYCKRNFRRRIKKKSTCMSKIVVIDTGHRFSFTLPVTYFGNNARIPS